MYWNGQTDYAPVRCREDMENQLINFLGKNTHTRTYTHMNSDRPSLRSKLGNSLKGIKEARLGGSSQFISPFWSGSHFLKFPDNWPGSALRTSIRHGVSAADLSYRRDNAPRCFSSRSFDDTCLLDIYICIYTSPSAESCQIIINPLPSTNFFRIIYQQFIYEASSLQIKWYSTENNHSNDIQHEILLLQRVMFKFKAIINAYCGFARTRVI